MQPRQSLQRRLQISDWCHGKPSLEVKRLRSPDDCENSYRSPFFVRSGVWFLRIVGIMRGQKGTQLAQNPVMASQKGAPWLAKQFGYVGKRESDGVPQVQQLSFGLRKAAEGVIQSPS